MDIRKLSLGIAAAAALLPALSHADPEDRALNACAKAFAAKLSTAGIQPAFRLTAPPKTYSPVTAYYASKFTFTLQARSKSGTPLAEASCTVNSSGDILELKTSTPPSEATLAAR